MVDLKKRRIWRWYGEIKEAKGSLEACRRGCTPKGVVVAGDGRGEKRDG